MRQPSSRSQGAYVTHYTMYHPTVVLHKVPHTQRLSSRFTALLQATSPYFTKTPEAGNSRELKMLKNHQSLQRSVSALALSVTSFAYYIK